MLLRLFVKNMALIKEADVEFKEGLNIITGETGAGKSLVLGSVNIALGDKFPKDLIRDDAENAIVELTFASDDNTRKILLDNDIEDIGDEVIVTRKVSKNKSVSKINGETVSVKVLKEVVSHFIDIHSQHDHRSLIHKEKHLEILDKYAGENINDGLDVYYEKLKEYKELLKETEKFDLDETERNREKDLLEFEIKQIDDAKLIPGEDETLEKDFERLSHSRQVLEYLDNVNSYLTGDGNSSVLFAISDCASFVDKAYEYDSSLNDIKNKIIEIDDMVNDFAREVSRYIDGFDSDDEKLSLISERLDEINHLKMKYGKSISDILDYRDKQNKKLDFYNNYEEKLRIHNEKCEDAKKELEAICGKLHKIREKYAKNLKEKIIVSLSELNFLDVKFDIEVRNKEQFFANGYDEVEFLISTNPGEEIRPLKDVASGGELSRIMLAIKTILADVDETGTVVFDEIDTGISGITAGKVAKKLACVSKNRQVICITHLSQIVAMADNHYLISKEVKDEKTITQVKELNEEEQIMELVRINNGDLVSDEAISQSKTLKNAAKEYKEKM